MEERDQSEKLQTTMVSAKKSAPEKKRKKTIKVNNSAKKRKDDNKNKTSNGGVVPVTYSSSSSDSRNDVETGVEITQKPTGRKNSKQKAKRQFAEKEDANLNKFPMERVRRIIRSEDSDMRITNEAVFLVNKATEKFLEKFCNEAYICSVQDRKKSLAYKHLSSVVSKRKRYDFLSDFVPEKVKAEDALAERKLMEPETAW